MKNLLYFVILLVLSSCMTVGRIQRNCDQFAKICVTETTTEIRYRDTLVYLDPIPVRLPNSDINISQTLTVVDGVVNLPVQIHKTGLITTEVSVVNNELQVNSYLNDSTILFKPDPVLINDGIREERQKNLVPVKYVPGFYRFTFWLFIAQALLIVFWILVSVRRLDIKGMLKPVLSILRKKEEF